MRSSQWLCGSLIFSLTLGAPLSIILVEKRDVDYKSAFSSAVNATWSTFWDTNENSWNVNDPECGESFNYPSVWQAAVAGKAITDTFDTLKIDSIAQSLIDNYLNSNNWFSASTAKDDDVYTDDNSQAVWVLIDSYKYAGNVDHLNIAKKVLTNIQGQWDSTNGGVRWKINGDYLASISTSESALAAVRLYEITKDQSLLTFAQNCIQFLFDHLQDSLDHLFYDGINYSTGDLDKGKLTYTVGTAISTLAHLIQNTNDDSYVTKATQLAKAAINKKGAFYDGDGLWNNQLQYIHLLYAGLVDLITVSPPTTQDQSSFYQELIAEMERQADFTFNYLQIDNSGYYYHNVNTYSSSFYLKFSSKYSDSGSYKPDADNFCNGDTNGTPRKSLMDNASAAQIFYEISRVA